MINIRDPILTPSYGCHQNKKRSELNGINLTTKWKIHRFFLFLVDIYFQPVKTSIWKSHRKSRFLTYFTYLRNRHHTFFQFDIRFAEKENKYAKVSKRENLSFLFNSLCLSVLKSRQKRNQANFEVSSSCRKKEYKAKLKAVL